MSNGTQAPTPSTETGTTQTSQQGTETYQATPGTPVQGSPAQPPEPDYRTKFAESTREAQRLFQENLQLRAALQQAAMQQAPPSQPIVEPNIYADFSDGVMDKDPQKIGRFAQHIKEEAKREVIGDIASQAQQAARVQSSIAYMQRELQDINSPVTQEAVRRYQELVLDPGAIASVAPDVIPIGGVPVNPHLMRMAILEAKARVGSAVTSLGAQAAHTTDYFSEPARPASATIPGQVDYQRHLSAAERVTAEHVGMTYERYWKNLDNQTKEARLKVGRPVKVVKGVPIG